MMDTLMERYTIVTLFIISITYAQTTGSSNSTTGGEVIIVYVPGSDPVSPVVYFAYVVIVMAGAATLVTLAVLYFGRNISGAISAVDDTLNDINLHQKKNKNLAQVYEIVEVYEPSIPHSDKIK